ncbi:MAG: DIP1984 family protein [Bacteroidales bacterium]|nr:DIP1984 family protein [Bacteroidales bacterium]
MKLAEALQERADLINKIEQLSSRLNENATVQECEKPAENPSDLLAELDKAVDRLQYLMAKINLTNCKVVVDGETLTELIAQKDALEKKSRILRNFASCASRTASRASRTEIKILSSINVHDMQVTIDELSKQIRLINTKLQQTNWTADLVEE